MQNKPGRIPSRLKLAPATTLLLFIAAMPVLSACLPSYDPLFHPEPRSAAAFSNQARTIVTMVDKETKLSSQVNVADFPEGTMFQWDFNSDNVPDTALLDDPTSTTTYPSVGNEIATLTVVSPGSVDTFEYVAVEVLAGGPFVQNILLEAMGGVDCSACAHLEHYFEDALFPLHPPNDPTGRLFMLNHQHKWFPPSVDPFEIPETLQRVAEFDAYYDSGLPNISERNLCPGSPRAAFQMNMDYGSMWCGYDQIWGFDVLPAVDDLINDTSTDVQLQVTTEYSSGTLFADVALMTAADFPPTGNAADYELRVYAYEDDFIDYYAPNGLKDLHYIVRQGMNFDPSDESWQTLEDLGVTADSSDSFAFSIEVPASWENNLGAIAFVMNKVTGEILNVHGFKVNR